MKEQNDDAILGAIYRNTWSDEDYICARVWDSARQDVALRLISLDNGNRYNDDNVFGQSRWRWQLVAEDFRKYVKTL